MDEMAVIRQPAVAGRFYPDDAGQLRSAVQGYLNEARLRLPDRKIDGPPKAIIVPHAGYVYSGSVAASAYAQLEPFRDLFRRVVLLGPSHYFRIRGLAACHADIFETPLGPIPVDTAAVERLLEMPQVERVDAAHAREHSLEVHLPFLQQVLDDFRLIPLTVGDATPDEVAEVIEALWGGSETLFVISSDLSHFHDYETARRLDRETSQTIESLRYEELRGDRACGFKPISGLLDALRKRNMHVRLLDLRNSGDTGGDRDRVVGYGAYVID
jgi:AmmeMemoRadiSam system protein B